jgi:hypothetical protein
MLSMVIAVGFGLATFELVAMQHASEWIVINCGLWLCIFGLVILRTMSIRSVGLQLLSRLNSGRGGAMEDNIEARLDDMHKFGLIETTGAGNVLTTFGRLVGTIVATVYKLVGLKS